MPVADSWSRVSYPAAMLDQVTALMRLDFASRHRQSAWGRVVVATAVSLAGDALLVVIGQAMFRLRRATSLELDASRLQADVGHRPVSLTRLEVLLLILILRCLQAELAGGRPDERVERRILRVIAITFYLLAAYVAISSAVDFATRLHPGRSPAQGVTSARSGDGAWRWPGLPHAR
jgi:hypothetical protein